jgi:ATP-binding cassette subfamily F protein 3
VLEISAEGLTEYLGDYDYYLEKKAVQAVKTEIKTSTGNDWQKRKETEARERSQKNHAAKLEEKINQTETRIKELDNQLHDEAIAHETDRINVLFAEKTSLEEELLILYKEWVRFGERDA